MRCGNARNCEIWERTTFNSRSQLTPNLPCPIHSRLFAKGWESTNPNSPQPVGAPPSPIRVFCESVKVGKHKPQFPALNSPPAQGWETIEFSRASHVCPPRARTAEPLGGSAFSRLLGHIHSGVGGVQQSVPVGCIFGKKGDAHAGRSVDLAPLDCKGLVEAALQP